MVNSWLQVLMMVASMYTTLRQVNWHIHFQVRGCFGSQITAVDTCTWIDHTMAVRTLTFASDNRTLISGCDDKCIHVYDVEHGQLASILTGHSSWILTVAANPNISKQQLASGSADGKVKIWDLGMRSVIETHEGDEGEVNNTSLFLNDSLIHMFSRCGMWHGTLKAQNWYLYLPTRPLGGTLVVDLHRILLSS